MTRLDAAGAEDVQHASDCDGPRALRLEARDVPLGGVRAMEVRRILPHRELPMVASAHKRRSCASNRTRTSACRR
jgi:hypothetical protein